MLAKSPLLGGRHLLKLHAGKSSGGRAAGVQWQVPTVSEASPGKPPQRRSRCLEGPRSSQDCRGVLVEGRGRLAGVLLFL